MIFFKKNKVIRIGQYSPNHLLMVLSSLCWHLENIWLETVCGASLNRTYDMYGLVNRLFDLKKTDISFPGKTWDKPVW